MILTYDWSFFSALFVLLDLCWIFRSYAPPPLCLTFHGPSVPGAPKVPPVLVLSRILTHRSGAGEIRVLRREIHALRCLQAWRCRLHSNRVFLLSSATVFFRKFEKKNRVFFFLRQRKTFRIFLLGPPVFCRKSPRRAECTIWRCMSCAGIRPQASWAA